MTRTQLACGIAVCWLCAFAAPAKATVLFSNLGEPESFDPNSWFNVGDLPPDLDIAFSLTTPIARDFTLDSVDIAISLDSGVNDTLEVWLMDDAGGLPGAIIETMIITGISATPTIRTATSASFPLLESGEQYWIAASVAPGASTLIHWHANLEGDTGTLAQRFADGAWISGGAVTRGAFRVLGTVAPEQFQDAPRVTAYGGTRSFSTNYTYVASTGITVIGTANSTNYEMNSGYWYQAMSPVLPDYDLNLDDLADGLDIEPLMTLVLAGVGGDPFLIPHADFDQDGVLDVLDDVPQFIERLLYGLLPSAANTPRPIPVETGVPGFGIVLDWETGERANSFDVYFGFDEGDVRDATTSNQEFNGNTTLTEWLLFPLPPSFTVYWRIDSIGIAGTSKGTVWSFTTAP